MQRTGCVERRTRETEIRLRLNLDGRGQVQVCSGVGFLDHMLTLWAVHGLFDLELKAQGDLQVDYHHTVEDVGIVLGDALRQALGERKGIRRFGQAAVPMDEALCQTVVDLSNRPYLVFNVPAAAAPPSGFNTELAEEFWRAFAVHGGLNLHVNVAYGRNGHHILESIFKSVGQALEQAVQLDARIETLRSSKGVL
jgi:imidazoleglycerol-phosphate dehydratase